MELNKKVVIITGGSNGVGYETAKIFKHFDSIVYVLDIDDSKKNEFCKIEIKFIKCDISDGKSIQKAMSKIYCEQKRIDILINNAAIQDEGSFDEYDYNKYLKIMNTNYFGTCNCTFEALKFMKEGATILNVLSIHSSKPRPYKYAYDSSKSATEIFTKDLALEISEREITINSISFGATETSMNKIWEYYTKKKEIAVNKVPLKLIFKPKQLAIFIKIIVESFSEYTTGSNFIIDGGRSLQ